MSNTIHFLVAPYESTNRKRETAHLELIQRIEAKASADGYFCLNTLPKWEYLRKGVWHSPHTRFTHDSNILNALMLSPGYDIRMTVLALDGWRESVYVQQMAVMAHNRIACLPTDYWYISGLSRDTIFPNIQRIRDVSNLPAVITEGIVSIQKVPAHR